MRVSDGKTVIVVKRPMSETYFEFRPDFKTPVITWETNPGGRLLGMARAVPWIEALAYISSIFPGTGMAAVVGETEHRINEINAAKYDVGMQIAPAGKVPKIRRFVSSEPDGVVELQKQRRMCKPHSTEFNRLTVRIRKLRDDYDKSQQMVTKR